MPNFQALSISRKQDKFGCTLFAELHSQDTWALPRIFILFWIPEKIPTKIKPPKKYLPNFLAQKNPRIKNFKLKKIFDHPRHL